MIERLRREDDGVALVMALIFLFVVSIFITVALEKSQSTSMSGGQLRERGKSQYALDGAIDRAYQVLQTDISTAAPLCPGRNDGTQEPEVDITGVYDSGGLTLNGQGVRYTCQTLAGSIDLASGSGGRNYAVMITGTASDSLETQGAGDPFVISGSLYLADPRATLTKPIQVSDGDIVADIAAPGCDARLAAIVRLQLSAASTGVKGCTYDHLATAKPSVHLPEAPTTALQTLPFNSMVLPAAPSCRVLYPGLYTASPLANNGDYYLVSGYYYFLNAVVDVPNNVTVRGGQKVVSGDRSPSTASSCDAMDDATAMAALTPPQRLLVDPYVLAHGATLVFGGVSRLEVKGSLVLYTPPAPPSGIRASIIAARPQDEALPKSYVRSQAAGFVLDTPNANPDLVLNAKVFADTAAVRFYSTNPTLAYAHDGLVATKLLLKGSNSSGGFAISAPGGANRSRAPWRTVRVTATQTGTSNGPANVSVAKIYNDPPYLVDVLSWRSE